MKDNLHVLPSWKRGATASERLEEIALYARVHPEKFQRFAVVSQEVLPSGNWKLGVITFQEGGDGLTFLEKLGMFSSASHKAWEDSKQ